MDQNSEVTALVAMITPDQIRAFNTLLHRLGLMHQKATMIGGATNGRTESTKELMSWEARELIRQLNNMVQDETDQEAKIKKMRGKIFYYAHEMHWTKQNTQGRVVADGKRVDEWCIKFSYLKKKLNAYKYIELTKLVSQFQNVYKAFLKGL